MANILNIQSEIRALQGENALSRAEITRIEEILNNGTASPTGAIDTPDGTSTISVLRSQIDTLNNQIKLNSEAIVGLQNEIPLASTTHPTERAQGFSKTILRDYRHAKKIFVDSNYRLSPKYGFLFYVEFDFNPAISGISNKNARELGMIVKSVNLPKYTIDTKVHNAYNRVNIVQNKIKYDPVSITFHDDQSDNVKQFWYDYYSYFYRDPDYADSTYNTAHKYDRRASFDWGYTPRPGLLDPETGRSSAAYTYGGIQPYQYIQAIRIYSLYQGKFSEYQLVNPTITSFKHGELDNSQGQGLLEHQMTVQFETVKYLEGYVTHNTAGGFIDLSYDNTPSPNGTKTNTSTDVVTDLANPYTTAGNPMMRTDYADNANFGSTFAGAFASATGIAGGGLVNNGGFSIPSFAGLTQGLSNSAFVNQQLQAAGIGIAGRAAGQIAGSIVGGVAQGLGPNGRSIIGLAAAAIANPNAALKTVENMAISYATGVVSGAIQNALAPITAGIQSSISGFIGDNITTPISNAWGEGTSWLSGQATGLQTSLTFGSSGTGLFSGLENGGILDGGVVPPPADFATSFNDVDWR